VTLFERDLEVIAGRHTGFILKGDLYSLPFLSFCNTTSFPAPKITALSYLTIALKYLEAFNPKPVPLVNQLVSRSSEIDTMPDSIA